jgi:hypothetical protein
MVECSPFHVIFTTHPFLLRSFAKFSTVLPQKLYQTIQNQDIRREWRNEHQVGTLSDSAMVAYDLPAKVNGMSIQGSVQGTTNGTMTTTKSTTTNGTSSTSSTMTSSSYQQHNVQAVTVLREIISKIHASSKRSLNSTSAEVFEESKDVGVVLDFIAGERLRRYPHPGSKYDKTLRWAEYFATQVHAFSETVSEFVLYSSEAAHIMFGSCMLLLQVSSCCEDPQNAGAT